MKIGIDLDKTLVNCNSLIYSFLTKSSVAKSNLSKSQQHDISDAKILKCSLINKLVKFLNPREYIAYPDAIETINLLAKKGFKIYLISNRPILKSIVALTQNWLQQNHVAYDKLVLACKNKPAYAQSENIDFFVDDLQDNCLEFLKVGVQPLCFGKASEKEKSIEGNLQRFDTWENIKNYFHELEKKIEFSTKEIIK